VNLKSSAIKNEYASLQKFITFLTATRNLAVTDATLNGSLVNLSSVISTFQGAALRTINMDRNKKSTRNMQVGLPFRMEEVTKQFSDSALLAKVSLLINFHISMISDIDRSIEC